MFTLIIKLNYYQRIIKQQNLRFTKLLKKANLDIGSQSLLNKTTLAAVYSINKT